VLDHTYLRAGMSFHWGSVQLYANNALHRQAWNNPQNAFGQSSFGGAGCSVSGGPNCNTFITIGIQFDYTFKERIARTALAPKPITRGWL
jgi:hypothetical protein